MERIEQSTTAGVMEWTPAPDPPSPASPGGSELSWEGGGGGEEDDFQSQMDERGIIGLEETQGEEPMLGSGEELGPDEDKFASSLYFEKVRALLLGLYFYGLYLVWPSLCSTVYIEKGHYKTVLCIL